MNSPSFSKLSSSNTLCSIYFSSKSGMVFSCLLFLLCCPPIMLFFCCSLLHILSFSSLHAFPLISFTLSHRTWDCLHFDTHCIFTACSALPPFCSGRENTHLFTHTCIFLCLRSYTHVPPFVLLHMHYMCTCCYIPTHRFTALGYTPFLYLHLHPVSQAFVPPRHLLCITHFLPAFLHFCFTFLCIAHTYLHLHTHFCI